MKATINSYGNLMVERSGKFKDQYCPFTSARNGENRFVECGDWCPFFWEGIIYPYTYPVVSIVCAKSSVNYEIAADYRAKEEG